MQNFKASLVVFLKINLSDPCKPQGPFYVPRGKNTVLPHSKGNLNGSSALLILGLWVTPLGHRGNFKKCFKFKCQ